MTRKIDFTACEHLKFDDNYNGNGYIKKIVKVDGGKICWLRVVGANNTSPAMVFFCSERGRINYTNGCISSDLTSCFMYKEYNFKDIEYEDDKGE